MVHAAMGDTSLARSELEHLAELAPMDAMTWLDLGRVLGMAGAWEDALAAFRQCLTCNPQCADAWHNLGVALRHCDDPIEAFAAWKRAITIQSDRADTYLALGGLLTATGQIDDACICFERAARIDPSLPQARVRAATVTSMQGDVEQAAALFRQSLSLDAGNAEGWFGLGRSYEELGRADEARRCYGEALRLEPEHPLVLMHCLGLGGDLPERDLAERSRTLAEAEATPTASRSLIAYGLAKYHDRRGDFGTAAHFGTLANAARHAEAGPFDREKLAARVDAMITTYDAPFFAARRGWGHASDAPVFIVGMPRSGTTLVEQIIAAHPAAHGSGEIPDLSRIAGEVAGPLSKAWEAAASLEERRADHGARTYLAALLRSHEGEARRATDKSPLNFFHLALAALFFPNARVIHCERDLRDNAMSIWLENFSPDQRWSTNLSDIAAFAHEKSRLMQHWKDVLPLPILTLRYEETVANIEAATRRIADFLGLEWHSAMLDFHQSRRAVQTPSRWQVRQPAHTRSVGRWKRYVEHLPELERLGHGTAGRTQ
ncbi:tetratricopeptide repeat-containing sulfotransferase family protein [Erythrobacter sp. W302b]|uniref:tetratricopeptide repeat-containing sulfotransferase family protein n=1 Tax=Erythrobacter sp. W302b TaxID=3389874 RepID=UPI00396B1F4C